MKDLHEAIVYFVLWRARQHTQGQHIGIPPIEWGQALTHDTDTNVTRRGNTRLRRAPAEKDRPADPNHPEQWEQANAPTRDTALQAAGLRTPDDDLRPPPTESDQAPPEVWCTVLERGHYYVVAATATSPAHNRFWPPRPPVPILSPPVGKSHCHVFLGGLDPGQAPLKTLLLMLRQT